PRTRLDAFDAQAGLSQRAIEELWAALRDTFTLDLEGGIDEVFIATYDVEMHLEAGTVDLNGDGTISLNELDVVWDKLAVTIGLDIPGFCVGGQCIVPNPFGLGCVVRLPEVCLFEADPDLSFTLDLGGALTSEISATVRPNVLYKRDPARLPGMNDWDARDAGVPDHWQIYIEPVSLDLDVIDIADTVGNLLEDAINTALEAALAGFPGWVIATAEAVLGSFVDFVRGLLDIGDDIEQWLSDLLNVSFGLFDLILSGLAEFLAAQFPLLELENPVMVLEGDALRIPVLLPIDFVAVLVNDDELVLDIDLGD
ncbi:MAG: hypothetical protein JHC95_14695, partial [Solirubrobacteraceae bacterium]|nr:hypothetical protein [Solirubrobacteraceae bacterium]